MREPQDQDQLFRLALRQHGAEVVRFMAGYERNPARREELQQELQLALWQSLAGYRAECSLRTWVYRVAHNVGATHVRRSQREAQLLSLEEAQELADDRADIGLTDRRLDLERVLGLLGRLQPLDRELMLLYLEGLDAAAIAEISGLSARNVATKVHRIKAALATRLGARKAST